MRIFAFNDHFSHYKLFFVNLVRAGTSISLQYLISFKSERVKTYSVVQSVNLLFVLSI